MHSNPAFRQQSTDDNLAFARQRGFGQLALNGDTGPLISHVPFILSDDGTALDLHLARPNPILRLLATPHPAVIAVSGPDGYVSPDWYGMEDQVPTWNYIAVHLRGPLRWRRPTVWRPTSTSFPPGLIANWPPKPGGPAPRCRPARWTG